jgi:hypothetical protein
MYDVTVSRGYQYDPEGKRRDAVKHENMEGRSETMCWKNVPQIVDQQTDGGDDRDEREIDD